MYHAENGARPPAPPGGSGPAPAPGLSDQAAEVWRALVRSWILGPEERLILQGGLEAWDTYQEARTVLRREGPVVVSESGAVKRNPAALVARDSFREYRDSIRQLGLESEVLHEEEE